jgi:cell division protein FtsN
MAEGSRSAKRSSSPSWLASLMGAVFLISAGFMLGLIVGVVKEEPELVMGHLGGQSEEVEWSEQQTEFSTPDVAAAGPNTYASDELGSTDFGAGDDFGIEVPSTAAEDTASRAYEAPQPRAVAAMVPAPVPVAAEAVSSPQSGNFSVQVGAFSENEPAERIADDLRSKGFSVYVTPSAGSRDGRWRVRVGPMITRAEADDVAQQLKTREQLPTWVVTE